MLVENVERRLLLLAGAFLMLYSLILTLSPAVREDTWQTSYRLSHWLGLAIWVGVVILGHRFLKQRLPERDPFLFPLASLLSGWGLLTVWRLDAALGLRQSVWLVVSMAAAAVLLARIHDLELLRRDKYVLLGAGLLLTALTLLLGTSPTGVGPRLWLGYRGLYFQPSEPLKLLLVVYLSAYMADRLPERARAFPLILPTLFVTGLALVLLVVQRDLGTASIFIVLYAGILYMSTGKRRVLVVAAVALILAAAAGFAFVNIVHARLESWLSPWSDPSGRSYQIVQSLLAIANGGVLGRGPGLGSPGLVPVAHSDFIFSAIAEETGLAGSIALLAVYALLLGRGFLAALRAEKLYHRLLAGGLSAYLGIQAALIIGGDLRLLPLTGVTLPFVSYGGSSLLTSILAASILVAISAAATDEPLPLRPRYTLVVIPAVLGMALIGATFAQTWWTMVRGPDLLSRTDNPRRSIADRFVPRGRLLDRNGQPITMTLGQVGSLQRYYAYPQLAPIAGYTDAAYGQAGLEASLDGYLRGLQGNPTSDVWWHELLYGTPPPGLAVRLSVDLGLQSVADEAMGAFRGAAVMLDARSGEILIIASHPGYDPNDLAMLGPALANDKASPLLNRAALGSYSAGNAILPLVRASGASLPADVSNALRRAGFDEAPAVRMPVSQAAVASPAGSVRVSPLQMAAAAAALSSGGIRPAPRIALAVDTPQQGWVVLPALGTPFTEFSADAADATAAAFAKPDQAYWEWTTTAISDDNSAVTWYLAGTLPSWRGTPLTLVMTLESEDASAATTIGETIMGAAVNP
ncbi:MAG: FtsW/RodA/SpoVE family cell cycle protein [Anaerolineales bacterium]